MRFLRTATILLALAASAPALSFEMAGTKAITLRTRDGQRLPIGTVTFRREGARIAYRVDLDPARLQDFFLSMREFKCVEGPEVQCYVPYPHASPRTVAAGDLAWLEHDLLFFYKQPRDFGAVLRNGLYYALERDGDGLVGRPQAIDLNRIAAPPDDPSVPPFGLEERGPVEPGSRWIEAVEIR